MITRTTQAPGGSYLLAITLFLLGAGALGITLAMNFLFGRTLAMTNHGQTLQSTASLVVDGFGFALMLAAGTLFAGRRRILACTVGLVGGLFLIYSTTNLIGFGASERLAAAEHRREQSLAQSAAAREVADARKGQINWLRATVANTKATGREILVEAIEGQIGKLGTPATIAPSLPADAQAQAIASLTGWSVEAVQTRGVIALSVLLILAKALGAALAPMMWPRRVAVEPNVSRETLAPETVSEPVNTEPDSQDVAEKLRQRVSGYEVKRLVDERRKRQVETFFRDGMKTDPTARIQASVCHKAYETWAASHGIDPMNQTLFGRTVADLGIKRSDSTSLVYYIGYSVASADEQQQPARQTLRVATA
jgi:hypothetical protein